MEWCAEGKGTAREKKKEKALYLFLIFEEANAGEAEEGIKLRT